MAQEVRERSISISCGDCDAFVMCTLLAGGYRLLQIAELAGGFDNCVVD